MHTPSYDPATADQPARVYYAGRGSRKHYGPASSYAIGALEFVDGPWRRRDAPLIEGFAPRQSVLEQLVVAETIPELERLVAAWGAQLPK